MYICICICMYIYIYVYVCIYVCIYVFFKLLNSYKNSLTKKFFRILALGSDDLSL